MKVSIGNSVKDIPKKYLDGVFLVKESQLEAPKKIRLTPFERFLFAELAWRKTLNKLSFGYLKGFNATHAAVQYNREGNFRFVVYYDHESNGLNAMAISAKRVWRSCPSELRIKEFMEFHGG